jgi:hypothetical protein
MKPLHINVLLKTIVLLGGLLAAPAWAACAIGEGTGMGGTGIVAEGTGMGGTGIVAGKVMFSHGKVIALHKGGSRTLSKGDPICVGDTIQSAKAASAQLVMVDNEMIAVRPETKIRIDSYSYRKKHSDNIALALLNGAARIISGNIGKRLPQNDLLRANNMTIGIRGTDHEAAVILPGQNAAYPAGVYDKVNTGRTFIKTDKGTIDILPNQVGFAPDHEQTPRLLQFMPAFYNAPSFLPLSSRGMELNDRNGNVEMERQQLEKSFEWRDKTGPRLEHGPASPDVPALPESRRSEHQSGSRLLQQEDMMPSIEPHEHH